MTSAALPISFIKSVFASENFKRLFAGEHTHTPSLNFTKEIVRFTKDTDFILELIKAGLPETYSGDTLKEIRGMVEWCIENGFDAVSEEGDGEKSPSLIMLSLVKKQQALLFHDDFKRPFLEIVENGVRNVYPLSSTSAKRWLYRLYYMNMGRPISDQGFKQAYQLLEAKALYDCPKIHVYLRLAQKNDAIVVNMADADGNVVLIEKHGYTVSQESPVKFFSPSSMSPLVMPAADNGDVLHEFRTLLGLTEDAFHRVLAFLISALKPDGPYFCLLTEGEQGSGKSFLCFILKMLIDPSYVPKLRMPDSERDLMIQAKDNSVLLFDNMSGLNGNMSDALCRLATGGGFTTRKLYTDDESQIFNECRPFICNGITGITTRPDLLERSISLKLPSMPVEKRKTESEILKEFEEMKPRLLDKLFRIMCCALKNFDTAPTPKQFRMADAAKWISAAEPETGLPEGTLLTALEKSQNEIVMEAISSNTLAQELYKVVERQPYEGLVGDLLTRKRAASPGLPGANR